MPDKPRFRGFESPNYTQVPDELFDELLSELSGAELKVTLYIIRRTFGFKKQSDNISISQMLRGITTRDGRQLDRGVGLSKSTLLQAVRGCADKGIIIPTRRESMERGHEPTNYRLNLIGVLASPPSPDDTEDPPPATGSKSTSSASTLVRKLDQGVSGNQTKPLVGKSDTQETVTKKQNNEVVNDVTANDQKSSPKRTPKPPTISDRALRSKYGLDDQQIGHVHRLVDKQIDVLGAAERNHAAYVKRAAEAVRDGHGNALDFTLSDFKQAASEIAVGSRPAYFHAMWAEALEKRATPVTPPAPTRSRVSSDHPERLGDLFHHLPTDQHDPRARLITDAERRGFPVPDYIRTADINTVNRWWATLPEEARKQP